MYVVGKGDSFFHSGAPIRPNPDTFPLTPYVLGTKYRVWLSRPVIAYESANASEYAWFAGLTKFPTGELLLRINAVADQVGIPGSGIHILSLDNGRSWPLYTKYTVNGSHTPAEPITLMSDGVYRGAVFAPVDYVFPGGDRRKVRGPYQEISNGGRTVTLTPNGVLVQGFPSDIGNYGAEVGFSWFGDIIQISSSQWISTAIPTYQGDTKVTCECVESTDSGHTWNVVGRVAGPVLDEGFSEPSLIRLLDGRLMCISRMGINDLARAYSNDLGRTWGSIDRISGAWAKAPRVNRLSGTNDYVLTTGFVFPASVGTGVGYAKAQMGLYLSTDPTATDWRFIDLVAHHNATQDINLKFDQLNPSTGYTSICEISPNKILVSYDQAGGAYGSSTRQNRVFVVEATIERLD